MSLQRLAQIGKATAAAIENIVGPIIGRQGLAYAIGYIENAGAPSSVVPSFIGQRLFDTTNSVFYVAFGVSSGNWSPMSLDELSLAELQVLDAVTAGTAAASKALVLGATKNIDTFRMTGKLFTPQAAPETATDTATLTDAQMLSGILVATPTAAAAYTVRTGTQLEDAVQAIHPNLTAGDCFDLTIINLGGTGDDITLTAASGITIVGDPVVGPIADVATEQMSSGTFRFRYTAANTFIAYRVS